MAIPQGSILDPLFFMVFMNDLQLHVDLRDILCWWLHNECQWKELEVELNPDMTKDKVRRKQQKSYRLWYNQGDVNNISKWSKPRQYTSIISNNTELENVNSNKLLSDNNLT